MFLDLHEIIEMPGRRKPFSCELDRERLAFPALVRFEGAVTASGEVRNAAGILELSAEAEADMIVRCDRCLREFPKHVSLPVRAVLQADVGQEEDDGELYPLEGDGIDVSDVLETAFILNGEERFLCREDCRGLCPTCGQDLNDGPCSCKKPIDPRLAALGQLLDDIQEV